MDKQDLLNYAMLRYGVERPQAEKIVKAYGLMLAEAELAKIKLNEDKKTKTKTNTAV